jgi:hypothetical protein
MTNDEAWATCTDDDTIEQESMSKIDMCKSALKRISTHLAEMEASYEDFQFHYRYKDFMTI